MLREEDCKPGVEVICIDSAPRGIDVSLFSEWLKTGMIYTIRDLIKEPSHIPNAKSLIHLNEITSRVHKVMNLEFGFDLYRFKLLDSKDIEVFERLLTAPLLEGVVEETVYEPVKKETETV